MDWTSCTWSPCDEDLFECTDEAMIEAILVDEKPHETGAWSNAAQEVLKFCDNRVQEVRRREEERRQQLSQARREADAVADRRSSGQGRRTQRRLQQQATERPPPHLSTKCAAGPLGCIMSTVISEDSDDDAPSCMPCRSCQRWLHKQCSPADGVCSLFCAAARTTAHSTSTPQAPPTAAQQARVPAALTRLL